MFEQLEDISPLQGSVSNSLLAIVADRASFATSFDSANRKRRREQAIALKSKLGSLNESETLINLVELWWGEETKWMQTQGKISKSDVGAMELYRLLVLFLRNHTICPFLRINRPLMGIGKKEGSVSENKEFEIVNGDLFRDFIEASVIYSSTHKNVPSELIDRLSLVTNLDLDRHHFSAQHKLLNKDIAILKGAVIGGTAGVAMSLVAGPVVGTWIGNLAGFSGAAATSFGLAMLGGGSLASGGFGMMGGSIVLGVAFSGARAYWDGAKQADIDVVNLAANVRNLPILLAVGRILHEQGERKISGWIRDRIQERVAEHSKRVDDAKKSGDEVRIKACEQGKEIYRRAYEMAETYGWTTMYDVAITMKTMVG